MKIEAKVGGLRVDIDMTVVWGTHKYRGMRPMDGMSIVVEKGAVRQCGEV